VWGFVRRDEIVVAFIPASLAFRPQKAPIHSSTGEKLPSVSPAPLDHRDLTTLAEKPSLVRGR